MGTETPHVPKPVHDIFARGRIEHGRNIHARVGEHVASSDRTQLVKDPIPFIMANYHRGMSIAPQALQSARDDPSDLALARI
jgi:hypothetical protein